MSRPKLLALAALTLAAVLFGVFHLLYEKVSYVTRTPPTGRAAVDPYYAAELVLRAYELDVSQGREGSLSGPRAGGEPPEVDAVFWFADEPPGPEVSRLLEEGALVVVAAPHADWVNAPPDPQPEAECDTPAGLRFVQAGKGELVIVPHAGIFTTPLLELPGHAEALSEIIARLEPGDRVAIVRRADETHLLALLFTRGLPAVLALLALLALLAMRRAPRFGPVLPSPEPGRRSFTEHLLAVGHFARRHKGEDALLASARAEVLERLVRRRPELEGLGGDALIERLLEHVTVDRETLARALVHSPRGNPRAFVDVVSALQELRRSP